MALSAAGDAAFLELDAFVKEEAMEEVPTGWNTALVGQSWTWTKTVSCMPEVDAGPCSSSPSREEVVQAPPAMQPP